MEVIGECICNDIIAEVKRAKLYSVIADEVTDTANREELSLPLHFVLDGTVKEVFVGFVEVERVTGQVLPQTIFQWLSTHGLSQQTSEVSAMMVHPICQEPYQDASPLFSKMPHWHCTSIVLLIASIWQ